MAKLEVGLGTRCGLYVALVKSPSLAHFQFGHLGPLTDTEEEECLLRLDRETRCARYVISPTDLGVRS